MEKVNGKKPHVLAVPFPGQGHVKPLMKLCRKIAKHGVKVTFVNIQSVHDKIVAAGGISSEEDEDVAENIELVSVPDNVETRGHDPNDVLMMVETLRATIFDYEH